MNIFDLLLAIFFPWAARDKAGQDGQDIPAGGGGGVAGMLQASRLIPPAKLNPSALGQQGYELKTLTRYQIHGNEDFTANMAKMDPAFLIRSGDFVSYSKALAIDIELQKRFAFATFESVKSVMDNPKPIYIVKDSDALVRVVDAAEYLRESMKPGALLALLKASPKWIKGQRIPVGKLPIAYPLPEPVIEEDYFYAATDKNASFPLLGMEYPDGIYVSHFLTRCTPKLEVDNAKRRMLLTITCSVWLWNWHTWGYIKPTSGAFAGVYGKMAGVIRDLPVVKPIFDEISDIFFMGKA